jgi:hypothetical protein
MAAVAFRNRCNAGNLAFRLIQQICVTNPASPIYSVPRHLARAEKIGKSLIIKEAQSNEFGIPALCR